MAKETFYFSHDYNARTDKKIKKVLVKYGMLGYGIYWAIIEDLYNNANSLPTDYDSIAYDLKVDVRIVESIITDYELFTVCESSFSSNSIQRRLDERNNKSIKAKQSAEKRWSHSERNANALPTHSERNAIKESKVKESKVKIEPNGSHQQADVEQENLKAAYKEIQVKDTVSVTNFIKTNNPKFIEPYFDCWNLFAQKYAVPAIKSINDKRKKKLLIRLRVPEFNFINILAIAAKSSFVLESTWFSFDWVIENDTNFLKVIEGNYNNKSTGNNTTPTPVNSQVEEIKQLINKR